jgi:GTP diphosphokinase / guanosine-3',5'-bis(diphosphate) 3'-diphosphatase
MKSMITAKDIIVELHNPTEADSMLINKAYALAEKSFEGITRYSGEPYITHLATVAHKLAKMGFGPRTTAAGILHDIIEDTTVSAEDIRTQFGEEILFLVEGVTKLSSVRYYGTDRHNESLRKLFVATSQDIRVLIIKLTDRLHNMETLEYVPKEKQSRIARETLEIYVPVAHRLGMGRIRKELEDLAFPYVYPEEYKRVRELLAKSTEKSMQMLERERKTLQKRLADSGLLDFKTSYRVKGLFSLFHKLKRKEWDISDVYDLLAMRVVVHSLEDCYKTLGIIHEVWRPLPKRVKDYIAFPKPNGYQSIHTTVTTQNGNILEIQIRTEKMHHEAEYGVASHIIYKQQLEKSGKDNPNTSWFSHLIPSLFRPFAWREQVKAPPKKITKDAPHREKIPQWIHQIGEMYTSEKASSTEFVDDMRKDFFTNRIFVFTPNGDVVDLPTGATPIDFAYAIHSEVGDHIAGAKINNKLVQLDTELQNGDIVHIETKKSAHPSPKWVQMAKTTVAKRHVRAFIAEQPK